MVHVKSNQNLILYTVEALNFFVGIYINFLFSWFIDFVYTDQ